MSDSELLPCPFCGTPGRLISVLGERDYEAKKPPYYGPRWWRVVCSSETGCAGCGVAHPEKDVAISAWNRRVTSSEPPLVSPADPLRSESATRKDAEAVAPKPDLAIGGLVNRLRKHAEVAAKQIPTFGRVSASLASELIIDAMQAADVVEKISDLGRIEPTAAISLRDPLMILAGIEQFGLASDGSDLRDLRAALTETRSAK